MDTISAEYDDEEYQIMKNNDLFKALFISNRKVFGYYISKLNHECFPIKNPDKSMQAEAERIWKEEFHEDRDMDKFMEDLRYYLRKGHLEKCAQTNLSIKPVSVGHSSMQTDNWDDGCEVGEPYIRTPSGGIEPVRRTVGTQWENANGRLETGSETAARFYEPEAGSSLADESYVLHTPRESLNKRFSTPRTNVRDSGIGISPSLTRITGIQSSPHLYAEEISGGGSAARNVSPHHPESTRVEGRPVVRDVRIQTRDIPLRDVKTQTPFRGSCSQIPPSGFRDSSTQIPWRLPATGFRYPSKSIQADPTTVEDSSWNLDSLSRRRVTVLPPFQKRKRCREEFNAATFLMSKKQCNDVFLLTLLSDEYVEDEIKFIDGKEKRKMVVVNDMLQRLTNVVDFSDKNHEYKVLEYCCEK